MNAFQRVDTSAIEADNRFDFWRSIHPGTRLEPFSRETARDFQASNLTCTTAEGVIFSLTTSTGIRAHFGDSNPDLVLLSRTLRGAINIRGTHEETIVDAAAANLTMMDCRRRATVSTQGRHTHTYLALPRRMVMEAVGDDLMPGRAVRALPDAGLFPFLQAQLRALATRGPGLQPAEAGIAVDMAVLLALSGLRELREEASAPGAMSARAALFLAARRQIELRHGEHGLTAESIAASLGCSRAHLYRAFAAHGTSIAALMRDIRLGKARTILARRTTRSIAAIAHDCGYGDVASFGRAFRARFGLPPAAWRDRNS